MGDKNTSPLVDFFAGTVSGMASVIVGHPFDTVKVALQTGQSTGAVNAASVILSRDGALGLFKGITSPMLGVADMNSMVFGSYGLAMRYQLGDTGGNPSLFQVFVAGVASGVATSAITTPIERLKIMQQMKPLAEQPSFWHLLTTTPLTSMYRGLLATLLRDTSYGLYFFTYEAVCRHNLTAGIRSDLIEEIESSSREVSWSGLLLAGACAGIVGWGATFFMDVIKTRIQSSEPYDLIEVDDTTVKRRSKYYNISSTARNSYIESGPKIFFSGLATTLLRSIPVNMVCFFVFEGVVDFFK